MSKSGKMEAFSGKSWASWIERLGFYFVANNISAVDRKRAVLLTLCGPETYDIVRALVAPRGPGDVEFEELVTILGAHFDPKPSELYSRYNFQRRDQLPDESINSYVAALKMLAGDCNFGILASATTLVASTTARQPASQQPASQAAPDAVATAAQPATPQWDTKLPLDVMLRDRFVCGIRDELLQQRLFAEKNLTFASALDIAVRAESASKQQQSIKNKEDLQVNKTTDACNKSASYKGRPCYRCTGQHDPQACRFKTTECHYCKKEGHIEKACIAKKKQQGKTGYKKANYNVEAATEVVSQPACSSRCTCHELNQLTTRRCFPKFYVSLRIEGKPLQFEVDSGAACSLISEDTFRSTWPKNPPKLTKNDLELYTWSGEGLKLLGSLQVRVRFKSKDYLLPLLVMKGAGCSLLGRDWFDALNIRVQGINQMQQQTTPPEVEAVLQRHSKVFQDDIAGYTGPPVHLELEEGAPPKFCKARPVPLALRSAVTDELQQLQNQGIIEPVQHSEWATPLVLVRKKSGAIRLCGDYRSTVNAASKKASYPLPTTGEVLSNLRGGTTFSTLDLCQAYQQLKVTEETAAVLTINTMKGLYRVTRLPFGISAAPAIFQRMMETTLAGIDGISVYLDDIIISGASKKEHAERLEQVLSRLDSTGLRLKKEKCKFAVSEATFLGHKIDASGVHTTADKVQAILDAPEPTGKPELQAFLGLLAFYDRFLKNRATVATDLYKLLQKNVPWLWKDSHKEAFRKLKQLVKESTVLAHYDENKPLLLSCDASPYGVGAVLAQRDALGREAPIAFASRTLGAAEKNYSQLDKEGLAIVYAVCHFHEYIAGRQVTIYTDHQPLLGILGGSKTIPQVLSPRMTRWCIKLGAYDYELKYRRGRLHQNADALSRLPLPACVDEPCQPGDVLMLAGSPIPQLCPERIAALTAQDKTLALVYKAIHHGNLGELSKDECGLYKIIATELSTLNGCLTRGTRVVIPSAARAHVLELLHAGHRGMVAMKAAARGYVWWPGVDRDIEAKARTCSNCQQHQRAPPKAPSPEWQRPTTPWDTLHIDFAGPVEGKMLLIIVDAFSKWLEVRQMNTITSSSLIQELRNVFATFGVPRKIVSDNGTSLVSAETEQFFKNNGIRHVTSAPYHPATNGQAERMVYETKQAVSKDKTGCLSCRIARFLFKQHTTISCATRQTPAMLMLGRELSTAITRLQPQARGRDEDTPGTTKSPRNLSVNREVFVKNFTGKPSWIQGTIIRRLGSRSWIIRTDQGTVRRHEDHIRNPVTDHPRHFVTEASSTAKTSNGPQSLPAQWTIPTTGEPSPAEQQCAPEAQAEVQPNADLVPSNSSARPQRQRRPPQRYGDGI